MSQKLIYPATERNKQPILDILKLYLPSDRETNLLEISSGSGQHVSFFAEHFPNIIFQPSEYDSTLFKSIEAYIKPFANILQPIHIDVTTDYKNWQLRSEQYEFILNVNMIHITPYKCTQGLFNNAQHVLKPNGMLITYGPYANNGIIEPESNVRFNQSLRHSDPEWGLRDIQDLKILAMECGLELLQIHNMPSNNKMLIWRKISE
ncbi:methyltransferase-like 26 [Chrysoperla carnea]|uniref:methyltransferase-like 26 n=1 Tax=Chrysoperla carnea TaxID=189513 RepID=UPI001D067B48|nr:methyltransferase-like 26 [Chrysoperla carnea]